MTCPRPDGTYAPWCPNIPTTSTSTTSSTTSSSTSTTTLPVVTTTIPHEPEGDDCTLHGSCAVTTTTTAAPPELPRTGSADAVPIGVLGLALIAAGVVTTLRTRRTTKETP